MRAEALKKTEDADFIPRPQVDSISLPDSTADDPSNMLRSLSGPAVWAASSTSQR